MKCARGWAILLGLLVCASAARAQLIFGSPYVGGYSAGGFAVGVSKHGHHTRLSAFVTGGSAYYSSYYGYPFYPAAINRVTFIQITQPPTVIVAPPPVVELGAGLAQPQAEVVEPPQERAGAGGFRPVRPAAVPRVPPPPKVPEVPPAKPPEKPAKPEEKPKPPRPPLPEADPRTDSAIGLEAFAAGEYGRASQRFRQAIHVNPNDARAYFLLAQAEFVLGKYDEAVEAIQKGMAIERDWPLANFRPVMLYGENVTDWPEHLRRLENALNRHPEDWVLLFLYAYELWFDGRQDEARPLFQHAAAVAPDKSYSERFLLARPDQPIL
jgi:hypothetical protein